nr:MAG TPA: hypothetical protein [Inoviridae sp.]
MLFSPLQIDLFYVSHFLFRKTSLEIFLRYI